MPLSLLLTLPSCLLVDTKDSEKIRKFAPADYVLHKLPLPKIVVFIWDTKSVQMHKFSHNRCLNVDIKSQGAGALSTELLNFCYWTWKITSKKLREKKNNLNLFYKRRFPWFIEGFLAILFNITEWLCPSIFCIEG